ncbi:hypothetical protein ACLB2K_077122 [Fragaria x ananassa]
MEEHAPRFNLSIVSSDVEVGGARLSAEYALSDEEIAIAHWWWPQPQQQPPQPDQPPPQPQDPPNGNDELDFGFLDP